MILCMRLLLSEYLLKSMIMSSFVANVFILMTVWCYSGLGIIKQKQAFGADCDESNNIFDKCVYI